MGGGWVATERLVSVQALRAVAALLVVFAHIWPNFNDLGLGDKFPNFILGAAGVDLFFVISGFVMVYTSESLFSQREAPRRFILRRVARIVPLYWLATCAVLLFYWFGGQGLAAHNLTWPNVVTSFFFVPLARPDGDTAPVLGVGWTLNYEMLFYLVFSLATLLPRRAAVAAVIALFWTALHLPFAVPQPLAVLLNPTIYEFALGMCVAIAFREGVRLPAWMGACLALAGAALLIRTNSDGFATIGRVVGWGGGASLIVAGFVLADAKPASSPVWLAFATIGDASYALYLLHSFALRTVFAAARIVTPATHIWLYATVAMAASIFAALFARVAFEAPVTGFLKRRLETGRARTIVATA